MNDSNPIYNIIIIMNSKTIQVDTWYGNHKKVWTKYPLKDTVIAGPQYQLQGDFEMVKKGIIRKNRRYFQLYQDKILYYNSPTENTPKGVLVLDSHMTVDLEFKKRGEVIHQTGMTFYKHGNRSQLAALDCYAAKYDMIAAFLR